MDPISRDVQAANVLVGGTSSSSQLASIQGIRRGNLRVSNPFTNAWLLNPFPGMSTSSLASTTAHPLIPSIFAAGEDNHALAADIEHAAAQLDHATAEPSGIDVAEPMNAVVQAAIESIPSTTG